MADCQMFSESQALFITDLPTELLQAIFFHNSLDYEDVVNLQFCCKLFHSLIHSHDIQWMNKFLNRWKNCILHSEYRLVQSWRALYRLRLKWASRVENAVSRATEILLYKDHTPKCLLNVLGTPQDLYEKKFSDACIIDELHSYLTPGQEPPLSLQYYSMELMKLFKVASLKKRLEKSVTRFGGINHMPLEDGLHFVGLARNPLDDYRAVDIEQSLNNLCCRVLDALKETDNSIYSKAQSLSLPARPRRSITSSWSHSETAVLVKAIVRVVLPYYSADSDDDRYTYYLEKFLADPGERRAGIILCNLLVVCLAERLAVHCVIMLCAPPTHKFLIGYIKNGGGGDAGDWAYIDLTRLSGIDGEVVTYDFSDRLISRQLLAPGNTSTNQEVLVQYSELELQVERSLLATELTVYLDPVNVNLMMRLAGYYLNNKINMAEALLMWRRMEDLGADLPRETYEAFAKHAEDFNELEISDVAIMSRSDPECRDVRYSVGMIMYHTRWGYDCVIYGWTSKCDADPTWICRMGVDRLPHGSEQPFYNVLVPDGTQRYAAQENLAYHQSPHLINHREVGKYMKSYKGTHYIMNDALNKYYPEDLKLTVETAKTRYGVVTSPAGQ